jgi:hypothetical protein
MRRIALLAVVLFAGGLVHAQGCSACRDNVAGSAPHVQRAYRRAIPVLGVPAGIIFVAAIWVVARKREETAS